MEEGEEAHRERRWHCAEVSVLSWVESMSALLVESVNGSHGVCVPLLGCKGIYVCLCVVFVKMCIPSRVCLLCCCVHLKEMSCYYHEYESMCALEGGNIREFMSFVYPCLFCRTVFTRRIFRPKGYDFVQQPHLIISNCKAGQVSVPDEVWAHIFQHMSLRDFCFSAPVSRKFYEFSALA